MLDQQKNKTAQSFNEWYLTKPVFFIGFMGAGKSTVARRLARRFHIASIDIDTYVERTEGKKTTEIFAEFGEAGFRDREQQVLAELATREPCFISCGGGIIERAENRKVLQEAGFVIYLKISVDEAIDRISNPATRPLLNDAAAARQLNKKRLPLYHEVADITLNTAGKNSGYVMSLVQRVLKKEGVLCQQPK